jgi:hypothetical protein
MGNVFHVRFWNGKGILNKILFVVALSFSKFGTK